jgi:thiol:disulfide interchange protein DsbC
VAKQYALGQTIGVSGTPAIVLANGRLIPGYQPAAQLAKLALDAK